MKPFKARVAPNDPGSAGSAAASSAQSELAVLQARIAQLEETLRAIRGGEVDALYVAGAGGERLFTLDGANHVYRTLIEEMGEGALTLTGEGVIAYANRHFAELLGRPLHSVIGSRIEDCFAPEGHEGLTHLLARAQLSKSSLEVDLMGAAGERTSALLSVSPLLVEELPKMLCMVVTDLSTQRKGEAAIQARQTLLKVIEKQGRTAMRLSETVAALQLRENALGAVSQGVLITDAEGITSYVNQAFEQMSGYAASEMMGRSPAMLRGPETSTDTQYRMSTAQIEEHPFHGEMLNYRKDGTTFWNEVSIAPVFNAAGAVTQFVGVHRDITDRKQADAQLLLAAKVIAQSSEGFIITDAMGQIVKVNQAFTTICGFSETEALGQNPRMLGSGRHDPEFFEAMWHEITSTGRWQGEIWNRRKDGSIYPQWLSIGRVIDSAGETTNYIASFSDMTQRKAAEESILRLAHYDHLTGLANRTLFTDRVNHALQLSVRSHQPLALLFIDLDHFKQVNDSLGHRTGDRLLSSIAASWSSALREQDTLSRSGGDEFVLLLPGTDATGAAHVAQKLLALTRGVSRMEERDLTITASIGIALSPEDGSDFDDLVKRADGAMYRAKQGGRNSFCFHTQEIQETSERILLLENGLRHALDRSQMQLHYQPQVSLRDGSLIGAEALLRWHHPELGWISPAEFIPIAERSGQIGAIGEWVIRTAVRQMRTWLDEGMDPIVVAVNVSAVQFRHRDLPDLVSRILEESDIEPQWLELELTESVASEDPVGASAITKELRARGVRISIDDFGTGYSSLAYLKRFKVYKLKIDQSFVSNVTSDTDDQAIVKAIIHLATSLGMSTIAEGVETPAQMEYLRAEGCDEMQGYFFSRPLPVAHFETFVKTERARFARHVGHLAESDCADFDPGIESGSMESQG